MNRLLAFVALALALVSPALADMYPDASNAKLPDALSNLRGAPHVATNDVLSAAATTLYPNGVWRDDYAAGNGAPPLWYRPSGTACSLNTGNGDNAGQVKSADGKCWLAAFPSAPIDIRQYGVQCGLVADQHTQYQAAINAASATGAALYHPASCQVQIAAGLTATKSFNWLGVGPVGDSTGGPVGGMNTASLLQWIGQPGVVTQTTAGTAQAATSIPVQSCAGFAPRDKIDIIAPGHTPSDTALGFSQYTTVTSCVGTTLTIPGVIVNITGAIGNGAATPAAGPNLVVDNIRGGTPPVQVGAVLSGTGITGNPTITALGLSSGHNPHNTTATTYQDVQGNGLLGLYTLSASFNVATEGMSLLLPAMASGATIVDLDAAPYMFSAKSATAGQFLFGMKIEGMVFDANRGANGVRLSTVENPTLNITAQRTLANGLLIDDGNSVSGVGVSANINIPNFTWQSAGSDPGRSSNGLFLNGCQATPNAGVTESHIGTVWAYEAGGDSIKLCGTDGILIDFSSGSMHFTTSTTDSTNAARNTQVIDLTDIAWFDTGSYGNLIRHQVEVPRIAPDPNTPCGNFVTGLPTDVGNNMWYAGFTPGVDTTGALFPCGNAAGVLRTNVLPIGLAVPLTSGTAANITTIALTSGDWDVWGVACYTGPGATTVQYIETGLTNAAGPPTLTLGSSNNTAVYTGNQTILNSTIYPCYPTPVQQFYASGPISVGLSTQAGFATSTMSGFGQLYARKR